MSDHKLIFYHIDGVEVVAYGRHIILSDAQSVAVDRDEVIAVGTKLYTANEVFPASELERWAICNGWIKDSALSRLYVSMLGVKHRTIRILGKFIDKVKCVLGK